MDLKNKLPDKISEFINNSKSKSIKIGCSDSEVIEINKNDKIYYLKIMEKGLLENEYNKLIWLKQKLPVPKVIMFIQDSNKNYLITEKMSGNMLCLDYYIQNPDDAIKVLSEAFKKLYSIDINNCPFDVSNDYKLSLVKKRVENKEVTTNDLKPETKNKFKSVENVLKFLEENTPKEELVLSHGDTSLPNVFADKDNFKGFIDVGESGIADKWFDLAICEKSIRKNYGEDYIKKFYESLNIKRDEEKINYYLYMMELYP